MDSKDPAPTVGNAPSASEHILKRRRIRKGTFSCWECKHRKKRCELVPGSNSCIFCQQHELPCTSQEFADNSNNHSRNAGQRLDRVEAIINRLVQQRNGQPSQRKSKSLTATSRSLRRLQPPTLNSVNHERMSRGPSLTSLLESLLPNPTIAVMILRNSKLFKSPLQINQKPHPVHTDPEGLNGDLALPPSAHPVLFARQLIQLALCLRHSDSEASKQLQVHLNESVTSAASRYFDAACGYVLSHDELICSLEGLQTLMLQGRYYITIGDHRKAWVIHRRASSIASTMGIPLLAQTMGGHADSVWFQLVYSDRFLSLMLGLPFAITEGYLERTDCKNNSTPAQRLEQVHVLAAGRIIARNMRMQRRDMPCEMPRTSHDELTETRDIDQELKKATRLLPSSWWLGSGLNHATQEGEVLESTGRLLVQMHQHYLLVLLHQPYLIERLCSDIHVDGLQISSESTYSTLAAAAASREMISHYLQFRGYHRSPSSRATDDKCFLACITLLFAHLDGHRQSIMNVLEHQRCHDIGIIERVICFMKDLSVLNENPLAATRSQTLSELLKAEASAADGLPYYFWLGDEINASGTRDAENTLHEIQILVPYCGNLHISRHARHNPRAEVARYDFFSLSNIAPDLINSPVGLTAAEENFLTIDEPSFAETY